MDTMSALELPNFNPSLRNDSDGDVDSSDHSCEGEFCHLVKLEHDADNDEHGAYHFCSYHEQIQFPEKELEPGHEHDHDHDTDHDCDHEHEIDQEYEMNQMRRRRSSSLSSISPTSPGRKVQRIWQCDKVGCYKVFTSLVGFRYHMRRGHIAETKKKDKICVIEGCRRSFASYQGLNYHVQNHTKQDISRQEGVVIISSSSVQQKQQEQQLPQIKQEQHDSPSKIHSISRRRTNSLNSSPRKTSSGCSYSNTANCDTANNYPCVTTASILSHTTFNPSPLVTTTSYLTNATSSSASSVSLSSTDYDAIHFPFADELEFYLKSLEEPYRPPEPKPFSEFELTQATIY